MLFSANNSSIICFVQLLIQRQVILNRTTTKAQTSGLDGKKVLQVYRNKIFEMTDR